MGCLPVATHARFIINGPLSHACGHPSLNRPPISRLPVGARGHPSATLACGHPSPTIRLAMVTDHLPAACPWLPITNGRTVTCLYTGVIHCCLPVATNHHWPICLEPPIINRSLGRVYPSLLGYLPVATHH